MAQCTKNTFYTFVIWISITATILGMSHDDDSESFQISENELEEKLCILHEQASSAHKNSQITDALHLFPSLDRHTKVTYFSPHSLEESNKLIENVCSQHYKIWWYVTPSTKKYNLEQCLEEKGLKPYPLPAMICALAKKKFPTPQDESITIQRTYAADQQWQDVQATESNSDSQKIVHYRLLHKDALTSKGSLLFHDNWVGIFNIETAKEKQRKGFATILMNYLLHAAQTRGMLCAILESSPEAFGLYKKVGFKELFTTYIYYRQ